MSKAGWNKFVNFLKKAGHAIAVIVPIVLPLVRAVPIPHAIGLGALSAAYLLHLVNHADPKN